MKVVLGSPLTSSIKKKSNGNACFASIAKVLNTLIFEGHDEKR
jgi:hypothetical protein